MSTLVDTFVKIRLAEEDDFLKIKETLTRIGVSSRKENKLYQSCHILHKAGSYYIVHFKELFALDGKQTDFSEDDKGRRNTIAKLLEDWKLCKIENPDVMENFAPIRSIKIITHKQKPEYQLISKYDIGGKKK